MNPNPAAPESKVPDHFWLYALEQSKDGVAFIDMDGKLRYVNSAWIEMHGYQRNELLGQAASIFYEEKENEQSWEQVKDQLLRTRFHEMEIDHRKKDGSTFRAWLTVTMLYAGDQAVGYLVTARDITDWKQLQEALVSEQRRLQHQYERQRVLAEANFVIEQPHHLSDLLERIVQVVSELLPASGGCSILLWNRDRELFEVGASTVRIPLADESAAQAGRAGGSARWIVENARPLVVSNVENDPFGGDPIWGQEGARAYAGVPVMDEQECLGVLYALDTHERIYSSHDIDFLTALANRAGLAVSRVRLYEQLRQSNQLLQQQTDHLARHNADLDAFSHSVAHDLRNLLSSVIGYGEILQDEFEELSGEQRALFLDEIVQKGIKMREVLDALLLLARIRRKDVNLTPVPMESVVRAAQSRVQEVHGNTAHVLLPRTLPSTLGYVPWIEEVWVNYLSNAIKYGGTPPRIQIGAEDAEGEEFVRFWITDNGPGIDPADQARIFSPFVRLQHFRSDGHGLGLSIVRRIVERCGGTVGVDSVPGQGSTFWFTLRRAAP